MTDTTRKVSAPGSTGCPYATAGATATTEVGRDFFRDPFPLLHRLREDGPVHRIRFTDGLDTSMDTTRYVITRYEDAVVALNDPRLSSDVGRGIVELTPRDGDQPTITQQALLRASQMLSGSMVTVDPPDHTRLRRLLVRAFSAKRVEGLRPRIQELTDELLDRQAGRDEFDLIESLAKPLSLRVVCELLGVQHDTVELFRMAAGEGRVLGMLAPADEEFAAGMIRTIDAFEGYIRDIIEDKRAHPGDDLLSDVIAVREDGRGLSDEELLRMTALLIAAAYGTTLHLIGNGTLALLQHPEQLEALRADPSLLRGAVEEMMRYDAPTNPGVTRYAAEDVEIGGVTIPRGSYVLIAVAAANHDPRRWDSPERFDVAREFTDPQLGFGYGRHYCLGARLGSAEAEIAIGTLLRRYRRLSLAVEPGTLRRVEGSVRGVFELPIRVA